MNGEKELPAPFYKDELATIYHADCRELLPLLTAQTNHLVLTDPPYGVGKKYASYEDGLDDWKALMASLIPWAKANAVMTIMPSCQIKQLPFFYQHFPPDWLICWYKGSPGTSAFVGFNDWEPLLVYGKPRGLYMHDYFYTKPETRTSEHPCPKPVAWAEWLIQRATKTNDLVLDPFVGIGTTLVAAKKLGRRAIGIELEERYCSVAARRLKEL